MADLTNSGHKFGAMAGVRLSLNGDGTFIADATTGKVALRVSGPCESDDTFPAIQAMDAAPNGEMSSIVPAGEWKRTFAEAAKLTKRTIRANHRKVAVKIGENVTTFGARNGDAIAITQPTNIEGRFPPIGDVIPARAEALVSFTVSCDVVADVLTTIAKISGEKEAKARLDLHMRGGRPYMLGFAHQTTDLRMEGAICPCDDGGPLRKAAMLDRLACIEREREVLLEMIAKSPEEQAPASSGPVSVCPFVRGRGVLLEILPVDPAALCGGF